MEVDDIRGVPVVPLPNSLSLDLILDEDGKKKSSGVLICMSRRSIFGLYGDQSFGELPKVEEVDTIQSEGQLFSERTEETRMRINKYICPCRVASRAEELTATW